MIFNKIILAASLSVASLMSSSSFCEASSDALAEIDNQPIKLQIYKFIGTPEQAIWLPQTDTIKNLVTTFRSNNDTLIDRVIYDFNTDTKFLSIFDITLRDTTREIIGDTILDGYKRSKSFVWQLSMKHPSGEPWTEENMSGWSLWDRLRGSYNLNDLPKTLNNLPENK